MAEEGLVGGEVAVVVVGHHVEEVEVILDGGHVVGQVGRAVPGGDGHGEKHVGVMEFLAQHAGELDEVVLVNVGVGALAAAGVLPVQVQPDEAVLLQVGHDAVDEGLHRVGVLGHLGVLGRACVPPADGQHGLEVGPLFLEVGEALEAAVLAHLALRALLRAEVEVDVDGVDLPGGVVQVGKAVEAVGADGRVDVVNVELADAGPKKRKPLI